MNPLHSQTGQLRIGRLVLPVLKVEPASGGGTKMVIASLGTARKPLLPIFCSEEMFLAHRPANAEGLILDIDRVVQILRPDDTVVLDPGSPHATMWPVPSFMAMLVALTSMAA